MDEIEPVYVKRPRKMPSMRTILEHWNWPPGICMRCGERARCERSHLIDHSFCGLDGPQNVVPLCYPCHQEQPSFCAGEETRAIAWVLCPWENDYHLWWARMKRNQYPQAWLRALLASDWPSAHELARVPLDPRVEEVPPNVPNRLRALLGRRAPVRRQSAESWSDERMAGTAGQETGRGTPGQELVSL